MVEIEDPVAFLRVSDKLARLEESKAFESKKWVWIQDQKECAGLGMRVPSGPFLVSRTGNAG